MARTKKAAVEEKPVTKKRTTKTKKPVEPVEEVAPVEVAEEAPAKKKTSKKTTGKAKKEAPKETGRGRGRIAGVRNEVQKKDLDLIQSQFTELEDEFDEMSENITKFVDSGNKASVAAARKNLQNIVRMIKPFRATIQNAKLNMKQVKI